jgi:hypothetical protein
MNMQVCLKTSGDGGCLDHLCLWPEFWTVEHDRDPSRWDVVFGRFEQPFHAKRISQFLAV